MSVRNFIVAATIFVFYGIGAMAQGTEVAFGGLKQDPTLPVEISADRLKVNQTDGSATFTGNVVIGQGKMRLSAPKVFAEYGTENGQKTGKISRITASGGVVLVSGAEAAESQDAEYSVDDGIIIMTGDVILTQGQNVLSSNKMVVNLITGIANMEGRVKSIFKTGDN